MGHLSRAPLALIRALATYDMKDYSVTIDGKNRFYQHEVET